MTRAVHGRPDSRGSDNATAWASIPTAMATAAQTSAPRNVVPHDAFHAARQRGQPRHQDQEGRQRPRCRGMTTARIPEPSSTPPMTIVLVRPEQKPSCTLRLDDLGALGKY